MQTEERELRRSRSGIFIVVALALVFFALLALIVRAVKSRGDRDAQTASVVYVIPETLRVRAEASTEAAVVGELKQGEKVSQFEAQGEWARIETGSGVKGWVDRNYLEEQEERDRRSARVKAIRALPVLEGEALQKSALYSGPGLFYSVVGQLPEATRVKVFTRDHEFYAVDYAGSVAYVEVDAVDLSKSSADTEVDVAATQPAEPAETASAETPDVPAPPLEEEEPADDAEEEQEPVRSGVYAVVPPGGTEPRVVSRSMPSYPSAARGRGIEGTVVLRAVVHANGRVGDVEVLRDIGGGAGDAAAAAVERWRFRPATYQGRPIDVYYTVTVNFRLSD